MNEITPVRIVSRIFSKDRKSCKPRAFSAKNLNDDLDEVNFEPNGNLNS